MFMANASEALARALGGSPEADRAEQVHRMAARDASSFFHAAMGHSPLSLYDLDFPTYETYDPEEMAKKMDDPRFLPSSTQSPPRSRQTSTTSVKAKQKEEPLVSRRAEDASRPPTWAEEAQRSSPSSTPAQSSGSIAAFADRCRKLCPCASGLQTWASRGRQKSVREDPGAKGSMNGKEAASQQSVGTAAAENLPPGEQFSPEQSRSCMLRHMREAAWKPTICMYDTSMDPPSKQSNAARACRRAYQVPINGKSPVAIDNDHFSGTYCMLHRTPEGSDNDPNPEPSPYQRFFEGKARRWEVRVQGKFKTRPNGQLYTGCILEDFDYSIQHTWAVGALAYAVVPLMEAVMGQSFYFSWGSRGHHIGPEDFEFGTMVTSLCGMDQVIVTPPGEDAPGIFQDLSGMGLCRAAMPNKSFREKSQAVGDSIDLESTYTFCVWGCSPYVDPLKQEFRGLFGMGSASYEAFLDEWPAHFVLYSLDETRDTRHLEKNKTYFLDIMVWGSAMKVTQLPKAYHFMDAQYPR